MYADVAGFGHQNAAGAQSRSPREGPRPRCRSHAKGEAITLSQEPLRSASEGSTRIAEVRSIRTVPSPLASRRPGQSVPRRRAPVPARERLPFDHCAVAEVEDVPAAVGLGWPRPPGAQCCSPRSWNRRRPQRPDHRISDTPAERVGVGPVDVELALSEEPRAVCLGEGVLVANGGHEHRLGVAITGGCGGQGSTSRRSPSPRPSGRCSDR